MSSSFQRMEEVVEGVTIVLISTLHSDQLSFSRGGKVLCRLTIMKESEI